MLRRLALRDVVIVAGLELDFAAGFTVFTGETGAGKSILIDALQFALGQRADASLVREGAARAEVCAEFDTPSSLRPWLEEGGFAEQDGSVLLRRTVDSQGKSRAWINGSPATMSQLRETAEHLVDIHGQHAWQSLTRPAAVRALLDHLAGTDLQALATSWQAWRNALVVLDNARQKRDTAQQEQERLAWQVAELGKLQPGADEWEQINAEHQRLAHSQALLDGVHVALQALSEDEAQVGAVVQTARAVAALEAVASFDAELGAVADVLRTALAQIEDANQSLNSYLRHQEPDPQRLAELDGRIGQWVSAARRCRRSPADLPALLAQWRDELQSLEQASDLAALERAANAAEQVFLAQATTASALRKKVAPKLAAEVTQAMQHLGMAGGAFEVAVMPLDSPQSGGIDTVELRVAGHAGSTPRPLAKVASGGELSRLALAIAVVTARPLAAAATGAPGRKRVQTVLAAEEAGATSSPTAEHAAVPTLIFDEIDAGVGGTVADSVGKVMKELGRSAQVMAVTHLAQVAACADQHFVVSKTLQNKQTLSAVSPAEGERRVAEVARMLGGETLSGMAHAQTLLGSAAQQRTAGART